jgi:hypothetical protein
MQFRKMYDHKDCLTVTPGRIVPKIIPNRWIFTLFVKERHIAYYPSKSLHGKKMVVVKGSGKEKGEAVLKGYRVSVL